MKIVRIPPKTQRVKSDDEILQGEFELHIGKELAGFWEKSENSRGDALDR